VNIQDQLKLTIGGQSFIYANSILESVKRNARSNGVRWVLDFQFRVGQLKFL